MNQNQKTLVTLKNVQKFLNIIGNLPKDKIFYNKINYDNIFNIILGPPALHRFPSKVSKFIYESFFTIKNSFQNNFSKIFLSNNRLLDKDLILHNLLLFDGIGIHKAKTTIEIIKMYTQLHTDKWDITKISRLCPNFENNILDVLQTLDSYH